MDIKDGLATVIKAIIDNTKYEDMDMYQDIFEDRRSIFKHVFEEYFKKVEGRSCCVDKASHVAYLVDKTLKTREYYPLQETYREYRDNGGNIGGITELDEIAYWCPKTLKTTEDALKILFNSIRYKESGE